MGFEARSRDINLAPEKKLVWRVFEKDGKWTYDYALGNFSRAPFTTTHWIMNHIAQTGIMYLHCIKTGKPEGKGLSWDDLPVFPGLEKIRDYVYEMLEENRKYLKSIKEEDVVSRLNYLTPAPWGEMRPTWLNIWGGVIQNTLQHISQISTRKEYLRLGLVRD